MHSTQPDYGSYGTLERLLDHTGDDGGVDETKFKVSVGLLTKLYLSINRSETIIAVQPCFILSYCMQDAR